MTAITGTAPASATESRTIPDTAPGRTSRDRKGAALAFGFVALLLGSEGALTLPDENATAASVATFYADHRLVIVVLQLVGLVAAGLLAGYAWRLRSLGRGVARSGVLAALLACAPGTAAIGLALVADPSAPASAGRWNGWLPFADDVLFVGMALFTLSLARALGRGHPFAAGLAALTALLVSARLGLELLGHPRGVFESLGPVAFVVLVGSLGVLSARGRLTPSRT